MKSLLGGHLGWGRCGSNAPTPRSAEKKLELEEVWNIIIISTIRISESKPFFWLNLQKDKASKVKTFSRSKWCQVFFTDRDPLVSSAAVCVLFHHFWVCWRCGKVAFLHFNLSTLVIKSLFSLQFLTFRGQLNFNSQIYFIAPICRFLRSSIRQIWGSGAVSSVSPSSQQLTVGRAESLVVFRRGYSQKWLVV